MSRRAPSWVPPVADQTRTHRGEARLAAAMRPTRPYPPACLTSPAESAGAECSLQPGSYTCPRCRARVGELPSECHVCGLTLVASPHLARSYHHLFPIKPFAEVSRAELEGAALVRRQLSLPANRSARPPAALPACCGARSQGTEAGARSLAPLRHAGTSGARRGGPHQRRRAGMLWLLCRAARRLRRRRQLGRAVPRLPAALLLRVRRLRPRASAQLPRVRVPAECNTRPVTYSAEDSSRRALPGYWREACVCCIDQASREAALDTVCFCRATPRCNGVSGEQAAGFQSPALRLLRSQIAGVGPRTRSSGGTRRDVSFHLRGNGFWKRRGKRAGSRCRK